MATVFDELNAINVNDKTEKKKSGSTELTYLSWTWAWAEVKKRFPEAHYEIVMHDGLPYVYDENTGYMVFTNVTIDGITHMMWLPVMDGANKAMKNQPYTYSTKYNGEKTVDAATMFDVNKTIMRCLVKNLAMFGLGLYIYAGEDLPEVEVEEQKTAQEVAKKKLEKIDSVQLNALKEILAGNGIDEKTVLDLYKLESLADVTNQKYENIQSHLEDIKKKQEEKK
ncbi:MAG: DUF1071 domain-containing protein [Lachnospiraceae bacterium]|nr:DUF1071 domain-containing protein [Lachnospiraceae bacterium]